VLPLLPDGRARGETRIRAREEWITRQQGTGHDGRELSVLNFTHAPLGFLGVDDAGLCKL
jgi:hypothetical protein